MSWSDRRAFMAGAALLALGGCFRPMLAENDATRAIRHRIALPPVDGRFEHFLVESLEDRLGRPQETDFVLNVASEVTEQGIAVTQDDAVTRINLRVRSVWALRRKGETAALIANVAFSQSGYNATSSLFATRQTRLEIERRLARDIGERIARSILARADELAA
jgi:LPS-assembly lipoprotein